MVVMGECFEHRRADGLVTSAAIRHQIGDECGDPLKVRGIADDPALPLGLDEAGTFKRLEVAGHGVVGNVQGFADLAGGQAFGSGGDQEADHGEPCRLPEGCEGIDGGSCFHMSRFIDRCVIFKCDSKKFYLPQVGKRELRLRLRLEFNP